MTKILLAAFALALTLPGPSMRAETKAAPAKVEGKWSIALETPHGDQKGTFQLKQEGAAISGTCDLAQFGSGPVNGSVDGKKLTFSMTMHAGHGDMTFVFKGDVDGAKITGTTEPAGGTWTAKKQ